MGLNDILASAKLALVKIEAGEFVAGGREIVKVESGLLDIAADLGFKTTAEDAKIKAEIEGTLQKCHAAIDTCCKAGVKGEGVGKLGDGVLLKIILDAVLKFLPLIF